MTKRILFVVVAFLVALCCSQSSYGQAIGSLSGTVTDKSGAAIAGATVTITSEGTGLVREAKTDDTGHYIVNLLPVGFYTIHVEFKGFQSAESKGNKLQVDESRELDFTLSPASVSSTVEVMADAVAVTTTNPTLGQVITSDEVAKLPLNGRDFVQLATLTPGTTQETNPNSFFNGGPSSEVSARGTFSLSVGGSRANSTDWQLDGMDNNELTAGGIAILSSIDSIQEFKVLTYNYSAEFGERAGPTVLVTTKSGSNAFHGSLFEFFRNTVLDAKSFYATSPEQFQLNQFGGAVGGPIRKNKTFFFVDGEQKFQKAATITFTGLVPTAAMRAGDYTLDPYGLPNPVTLNNPKTGTPSQCNMISGVLTPVPFNANGSQTGGTQCNMIPTNVANPAAAAIPGNALDAQNRTIGQALINLYPLPNKNHLNPSAGYNFVNSPGRTLDETKFDTRLDHTFSASDTAFARFSYDQANSYVPGGSNTEFPFAEANAFGSNQGIINHGRNVVISETHVFSPTMVNQVSGGYNRIFNYITSQGTGSCDSQKLGIPGANVNCNESNQCAGSSCGLTSINLYQGYWGLGDRAYSPFQGGTNVFQIGDSFDMIQGKHDIKMGISFRANQMNVRAVGFQDGYYNVNGGYTGDATADLLLGMGYQRIHDQTFQGDITGRRWKVIRPYVQDDWRVTKDLTLNLGLGWSMATPQTESDNRLANFVLPALQLQIANQNLVTRSANIQMDWTAFEPRIGLAYKLFGSDKTVLRAGYAIFHDAAWSQGAQGLWQNTPFWAESFNGYTVATGQPFACTYATAACASTQTPNAGLGVGVGMSFAEGFPSFPTPPSPGPDTFVTLNFENPNIKQGQMQQWNVNVQRQLPAQIVLTVGYAGSHATNILNIGNNLNVGTPTACAGGPQAVPGYTYGCGPGGAYEPTPYPDYGLIYSFNDYARANYNSLQIKAETNNTKYGLYALIGYTYSRNYDTGFSDNVGTPLGAPYFPLPNWGSQDWALSQINLNNSFIASVVYDLPFGKGKRFGSNWNTPTNMLLGGWQINVIEKITSGFPVFIIDSNNTSGVGLNNNGASNMRPNQVGNPFQAGTINGCVGPSSLHTASDYFNPCAFAQPLPGELGTANRAPLSGPDFVNTDFSVIKTFALPWENIGLNFRAEFFNLFNHAQFGLPSNDFNSPTFGVISSTVNNPRLVQFALKLTF